MAAVWFNEPVSALAHPKWVTCFYKMKSIESTIGVTKMKHHLIAVAALAACGTAFAQSSVTVYGVADVAVGKEARSKTQMIGNGLVNNSNSYLGLRGVEDLGGGLKAGFVFEQGINLESGSSDDRANYGNLLPKTIYQRGANLWLGGNWGMVRLGRAFTPSRNAVAAWNIMGMANYSVTVAKYGAVGGNAESRGSSQIIYKTPDLAGFGAELAYVAKADNNNRSKFDVGLTYAGGPLSAGISYNKEKDRKANYAIGAKYGFQNFALAAGYHATENNPLIDASGRPTEAALGKLNGVSLGGEVKFGAMNLAIEVARDTKAGYRYEGIGYNLKKFTHVAVAGKYSLSKRTFFYADYVRWNGENSYGLGVQHNF